MKTHINKFKVSISKSGLNLVQFINKHNFMNRSLAFLLLMALLTPILLLTPAQTVSASSKSLPPVIPAVASAPTESFVPSSLTSASNSALSTVAAANQSLTSGVNYTAGLFIAPSLPEGFEMAKPVAPISSFITAISSSVGSVFSFFIPSSVSAKTANPAPNASLSQPAANVDFDFDGDGKADLARWRSSANEWQIKNSSTGTNTTQAIGSTSSIIAPGDFDNDGYTDVAVFNAGVWTIRKSSIGTDQTISFGTSGDKPVVGDYDGDGKSDVAVFRPSTKTWWVLYSSNGGNSATTFGNSGDITAQADYDGDGKTDIAIFRPSTGDWHILGSLSGYNVFHWGIASDTPVPADYDGDGKTDKAVYRSSTATWYIYKSLTNNGSYISQIWGNFGDQPVPADYDGDNKADLSVWRPTTGVWHTVKSLTSIYDYQTLGAVGDSAVPSAYLKQIGGEVYSYDFAKTRLSPKNATGGTDFYSRNFSWEKSLVNLPGRAGLEAGFGISYNSLVWTKYSPPNSSSSSIYFNADSGNVSPGFRFGFATIEPAYYDAQTGRFSYLMVTPSGSKIEFKQTAASDTYETADSSYSQLKVVEPSRPNGDDISTVTSLEELSLIVTGMNGTKVIFEWKGGAYRCSKIMDRNGNYITISHDNMGLLKTVTDTLGRIINVNYDSEFYPTTITQTWKDDNGKGSNITHTHATFTYTTSPQINTNFGTLTVVGPSGANLKVLQKITYPNSAYTTFDYNSYGQVKQVTNYAADNHVLNHIRTNLPADASALQLDCPRFTETYTKAENFNNGNEVTVKNTYQEGVNFTPSGGSQQTGTRIEIKTPDGNGNPDKLITKIFSASSGWAEGLPVLTEDWADEGSGSQLKRWTWANWTQDNTNVSYMLNPRVTETKIGDDSNIKKTEIDYHIQTGTISKYGLVSEVRIYGSNQSAIEKKTKIDYKWETEYLSRRIIGLPAKSELYDGNNNLMSKVSYQYDEGYLNNSTYQQNISPVQHDNVNYSSNFVIGRGNPTSTTRWDINNSESENEAVKLSTVYNTAGSVVARIDPLDKITQIGYADAFNDDISRNTYAYPTIITDPAGNYSEAKYRFDMGVNIWAKNPAPAGNTDGGEASRTFDSSGRLIKQAVQKNGTDYSYTKFEYPISQNVFISKTTLTDTNNNGVGDSSDEVASESYTDGAGRVIKSRIPMSFDTNGTPVTWVGQKTVYDILGRVKSQTVPTEINNTWSPTGDDLVRGWQSTSQEYDWKGRVVREIGLDNVDRVYSYDGCGCAGGQVTTIQGAELEPNKRRTQKIYADILGRTWKTEVLDYDNNVSTTNVTKYNTRDQAVWVKQFHGSAPTDALTSDTCPVQQLCQISTLTYDGHGRLESSHSPKQNSDKVTTYKYNKDDQPHSVKDGRGASSTYTYNNVGLVSRIDYSLPGAAGNFPTIIPNSEGVTSTPCGPEHPDFPDCGGPTPTPTPNAQPYLSSVEFSYDAVGNRTQMIDSETGTTNYEYDQLSRMTTEHKILRSEWDIPNHNFTIGYSYDLSGQLLSVTDPFDERIDYKADKAGRLKQITGTPFGSTGQTVTNYINNIDYRAWGTVKSIGYGNNVQTTQNFDNRLQVSEFEVKKSNETTPYIKKDYQYYNDNRLKFSDDTSTGSLKAVEWFDRSYKYDFAGRLTEAKTGIEARGGTATDRNEVPYKHDLTYNTFGEVTSLVSKYWTETKGEYHYFVNGRESNWSYDVDGRIKQTPDSQFYYDAAGNNVMTTSAAYYGRGINHLDGEGKLVRESAYGYNSVTHQYFPMKTKYFVHSTVLGKILTEVNSNGTKKRTFVYGTGGVVATQNVQEGTSSSTEEVRWEHRDPGNASYVETASTGAMWYYNSPAELDPMGANVGLSNPNQQRMQNSAGSGFGYPFFGDPFGGPSCYIDYILQPSCGTAFQMLQSGTGEIGPLSQIAAWHEIRNPNGKGTYWKAAFWERNAQGQLGYNGYLKSESIISSKEDGVIDYESWWEKTFFPNLSSNYGLKNIPQNSPTPNPTATPNIAGIDGHRDARINHDDWDDYKSTPFQDCQEIAELIREITASSKIRRGKLDRSHPDYIGHTGVWATEKNELNKHISNYRDKKCKTLSSKEMEEAVEEAKAKAPPITSPKEFFNSNGHIPLLILLCTINPAFCSRVITPSTAPGGGLVPVTP